MKRWLVILLILVAQPVLAHAMLEHASPAAGSVLHVTPKEVVLQYSEELEPAFSTVEVRSDDGVLVSAASNVSDMTIGAKVKTLVPGRYKVVWHAVSVDTHRTEGSYTFTLKP